jgi:hypothetical protein
LVQWSWAAVPAANQADLYQLWPVEDFLFLEFWLASVKKSYSDAIFKFLSLAWTDVVSHVVSSLCQHPSINRANDTGTEVVPRNGNFALAATFPTPGRG